jgi:hypothetical protein
MTGHALPASRASGIRWVRGPWPKAAASSGPATRLDSKPFTLSFNLNELSINLRIPHGCCGFLMFFRRSAAILINKIISNV